MDALKGLMGGPKANTASDPKEAQYQHSGEMLETSLSKCSRVSFLVEMMEKMGCKMPAGFFSIVECEGQINGGFHLDEDNKPGVVLCQNHIADQEWMDRTVAHELIHAFDHCRAKLDWKSCEHHACSEVRAAALSGDCDWKNEFFRKNFNIAKQHQICTRRRAKLSITNNEECKGKEDECLDKIFDSCYRDVAPYREIP
ncbi:hypothetical protein Poli38472_000465 [Pythium oligandrum]|uniref:Mitochondrial inner membrane protease ATP23 n=1 Tax=Pythium oligandrum TaxID=41045 RepID=A0A8K1CCD8_PYTOL|nr:hypothetical protein Poli38472_000465 [Pythium oligandrum]|eukprot:TMW60423.1 hypothetical protein Poli38472_000465 [Pythium oligandrum]